MRRWPGIVDIADRARTMLVQRLDGNLGDAVPLDAEVDVMLQEIEAALNTRLDRQYLFAGSRTDAPPVSLPATPITIADPALYYRGDDLQLSVRADYGPGDRLRCHSRRRRASPS